MAKSSPQALKDRIDAIEGAYEFMLAYAAQGHTTEATGSGNVRDHLSRAAEALSGLEDAAAVQAPKGDDAWSDFVDVVGRDAAKARTAMRFVLAQGSIGSQLIDNLNASLHLRALLTDLFLLDEAIDPSKDH